MDGEIKGEREKAISSLVALKGLGNCESTLQPVVLLIFLICWFWTAGGSTLNIIVTNSHRAKAYYRIKCEHFN